ncbi:MAG: Glu/Leu/Phe/Val dehydrogenase [Deltaproteobacteria bacterium]|nr:MAG: Glu/Leu/Phe/Val dehydrogenase [Deltaproteobacteria bacterium]
MPAFCPTVDRACRRASAIGLGSMPPERIVELDEPSCGLRGWIVVDDTTLGPAAGGVRTRAYPSAAAARADAERLARAMTIKCAIAGLDAGGGKAVIEPVRGPARAAAFEALGRAVEALGGSFYTAGDYGTTADDLRAMARATRYVRTDAGALAGAVARGVVRCIGACAAHRGASLAGLRVAVQGCGAIGAAVAGALAAEGARVVVADVDDARARAVADATGARVTTPARILLEDVDVVAPCAIGGAIDADCAARLRAWAVCGAANNVLADRAVACALAARGVLHVPDAIASAGAVIEGVGEALMGLADRRPLIDRLGAIARDVLAEADATGRLPVDIVERRARARLGAARGAG